MLETTITPLRYAAFSRGGAGGNPAGVAVLDQLPCDKTMQQIARNIGYSETVFAAPLAPGASSWTVRYFAPEGEVPFCGHATLALAYELGRRTGHTDHDLLTRAGPVACKSRDGQCEIFAPAYSGRHVATEDLGRVLSLFSIDRAALGRAPARVVSAGATHLAIELGDRRTLADMAYEFSSTQTLMRERGWVTIALFQREAPTRIHIRNAFAFGGVVEDPATGAAAAAVAGFLYAKEPEIYADAWIEFLQGDDMGVPCTLSVQPGGAGKPQRVRGAVRPIQADPI